MQFEPRGAGSLSANLDFLTHSTRPRSQTILTTTTVCTTQINPSIRERQHNPAKMNLRICTCPDCIKKKTTSNTGESISGRWLHPSTCAKHWSRHKLSLNNLENLALALPPTSPLSQRPEQNHPTSPVTHTSEEKIIYLFIVWLSLLCGVSQQNCQIARDWIIVIIQNFQTLPQDLNSYQSAHKDVWTTTKQLCLDPEIKCYTCCPKCFRLYEPEYTPTTCCYRRSKKLQVCGKSLMKSTADPLITQFKHISSTIQHCPDPPKHYLAMNFGLHSPCMPIGSIPLGINSLDDRLQWGMIPAPHKPDMKTISHILEPLVDELLLLNTGVFLKTPNFPNGHRISIHLGTLIGDIVASHKISGFASHSATFFCSCQKQREKRRLAVVWRETSTLAKQTQLLKRYGTRWSELNRLPYWDPVKNMALGVMHNWYEGVLQHHWHTIGKTWM
ncbi:hypothetical protein VP01_337g10 [Puccinia sorghi]|uniref:Uncharacterized protein n=1 Tax=Puccinia sorghi TaxID=27349 RepID=A0A0L6UWT1_9BASI|nr:hypothetical protein VP01_337g10 [Puccinia sorghi]